MTARCAHKEISGDDFESGLAKIFYLNGGLLIGIDDSKDRGIRDRLPREIDG